MSEHGHILNACQFFKAMNEAQVEVQLVNDIINKIFVSLVSTAHSLGNSRLLDKEVISSSTNYGISINVVRVKFKQFSWKLK